MKYFLYVICILLLLIDPSYSNDTVTLKKISETEFNQLRSEVKSKIINDMQSDTVAFFDEDQSFVLIRKNVNIFKLIPVTYASKKAINAICKLFIFSDKNQIIEQLPLHYVQGDGDEVVASCEGIQAVSIKRINNTDYLIYLLVERAGNQYGDAVFIASIESGKILKNGFLTNCVSNSNNIDSITKISKAIKKCLSKPKILLHKTHINQHKLYKP